MATEDINSQVQQNTTNGLDDDLEVIEKAFINYEEPRSPKTLSLLCKRLLFQEYLNSKPQNLCNGCRTKKGCMFRSLFAFLLSKSNPPVTKEECKQIIEDFAKNFNAELLQIIKGVKPNGKNLSIKDERKQLWKLWKDKPTHAQKFNIDVALNVLGNESSPKKNLSSKKKKRKDSDGESPSNDSIVSMSLSSPAIWNQDDILQTHHTQHSNSNIHMSMNPNGSSTISTLMETVSLLSNDNANHPDPDIIVQQGHIDNSNNNSLPSSSHQIMIPPKFKTDNKSKKKRKSNNGNAENGRLESEDEGETEESESDEDVNIDYLSRKMDFLQQTVSSNNQQIVSIVGTLNLMFHTLIQNNNQLQEDVSKLKEKIKKLKK